MVDYEQLYKERLKRAKELYDDGNELTRQQQLIVFPELAEADDKETLNEMIKYFESCKDGANKFYVERLQRYIDYLHKVEDKGNEAEGWKASAQEIQSLKTAKFVLTEERNFQLAGKHIQDIIDVLEGRGERREWYPTQSQLEAFEWAATSLDPNMKGYNYLSRLLKSLYVELKDLRERNESES